jgi:hypothetical protein
VIFHLEAFVAKFMRIYERLDPPATKRAFRPIADDISQLLDGHGLLDTSFAMTNECIKWAASPK